MEIGIWENVEKTSDRHKDGHSLYTARCKFCGKIFKMKLSDLKRPKLCLHKNNGIKNKRISGIFNHMVYRCYNEKYKDFSNYGNRGIEICDEWLRNPKSFEEWSLINGYKENLTIDRVDCSGNYCPENCRWISREENSRYKSTTKIIDVDGEKKTGRQWAEELNIGISKINEYRNKYGYENTVEFIRRALKYGLPELGHGESYYEKLMEDM